MPPRLRQLLLAGALALLVAALVGTVLTRPDLPNGAQLNDHEAVIPRLADDTTVAEARTTLERLGLVVELESVRCPTHGRPAELVLDVSPRPGTIMPQGGVVVLERCLFP